MKNKGVTILSIITNIILIAMLCSFIKINGSILKEKQTIKEMSESTQVTDLNNQINALNAEHTEYMNYIQTCKAQLASAITDMGIETSDNANVDTMVSNIRNLKSVLSSDFELISNKNSITVNAGKYIAIGTRGNKNNCASDTDAGSPSYPGASISCSDTNAIIKNYTVLNAGYWSGQWVSTITVIAYIETNKDNTTITINSSMNNGTGAILIKL